MDYRTKGFFALSFPRKWESIVFLKRIGVLFTICVFLIGCSSKPSPKLEVWTISLRPQFTSYMQQVIHAWETQHPGITIDWVDLPFSAVQQKLIAALASGHPPSVVNLNTDMALQLADMGVVTNLDAGVSPEAQSRYFPGLWSAGAFQGGHYAIPWYVSAEVVIYNARLFREAGLDPNHPPQTWDELIQDAIIIKQKTGNYGWLPAIKFIPELQEQGIPVVSPDGKKALFDSPEAVAWLQQYVSLFNAGTIPREALSLSKAYEQAVDWYQSGKLGMLQTGPQFLNRVHDNAPSVYADTRVAPLPLGKGNVISAATMNLVIPKNAPFQKEALDFALFLTNDENQLAFDKLVLVFPSTIQAASDSFFQSGGPSDDPLMADARRIGAGELKKARDLTLGLKNESARNEAIRVALENALLGRESPQEALYKAVQEWDMLLNE